ncbi:hypothetical protein NCAS_0G04130 [Naumovozyma castellii]|uniref:Enolase-phosphatase E1 n=1 Tax=Naumovozyma castellii TaxID=27288 RepID=G0VHJ3_NAUCA|nr:hypothetical protein NCAS_0G04130 [Naumovozyma castellii CBS 4309]CCC71300.1 hypothetical protein NCAS_0G04130 [Naumovozyma castellii CBS 4309]
MNYSAYLLDIEGTVCPISFVQDVLFPYFTAQVPHLHESINPNIIDILSKFEIEDNNELTRHILDLVSRDVKDPLLKQLQGYVWAQGYETGEIKAPVYPDAVDLIKRHEGRVYIYSSGSVKAQKLLFGHVQGPDGETMDLLPYIYGYFDINTSGKKTDAQSYINILRDIKIVGKFDSDQLAGNILFLSDNPLELDAAKEAGFSTGLAIRPGNGPVLDVSKYSQYTDYSEL